VEQHSDLFGNSGIPPAPPPSNDNAWLELEVHAATLFTPSTPISEEELFAGRVDLLRRMIDDIYQEGQHAVLYGERGIGKSSLANILKDKIFSKVARFKVIKRSCTAEHDFKLIWQHLFSEYQYEGIPAPDWIAGHHNPFDIYQLIDATAVDVRPIFIIDEFDRISDEKTKLMMADTIKYLSDYASKATIILVGVAKNVSQLIANHQSIGRNLDQIPILRMVPGELEQILLKRFILLNMNAEGHVKQKIIALSQGLPGYTHRIGREAALNAIRRRTQTISEFDLGEALKHVISGADEVMSKAYADAIRSTKPQNKYKEVLLACAMAQTDDRGYFSASSVKKPLTSILSEPREIPSFARHLNEFCDESRGPVLVKDGRPKSYQYQFYEPLLRPYVVIRGIADKLISHQDIPLVS